MAKQNKDKLIVYPRTKRIFDLIFSIGLLLITWPFFILFLSAIFIENVLRGAFGAPLFYREKRISQGREFSFIKFNIFKPTTISRFRHEGKIVNTKDFERDGHSLSIVGNVIRHIYMDELPQIFIIMKGDMTVVGPRPVNPRVYEGHLARGWTSRTRMKTGLTGRYQSHKGEPGMNQHALDVEYMEYILSHGPLAILWRDIKIICRTVVTLARAKGI